MVDTMKSTALEYFTAIPIAIVVGVAIVTDLRSRRIPNTLTFPAIAAALLVRLVLQGWLGLGLAVAGAVIAPVVLLAVHCGKGIGMGDLKLAAAVGAFFGPVPAVIAMLVSAVLGGVIAIALLMRRGQLLGDLLALFFINIPFLKRKFDAPAATPAGMTMPYGVAIGIGSLTTLAGYAWLAA